VGMLAHVGADARPDGTLNLTVSSSLSLSRFAGAAVTIICITLCPTSSTAERHIWPVFCITPTQTARPKRRPFSRPSLLTAILRVRARRCAVPSTMPKTWGPQKKFGNVLTTQNNAGMLVISLSRLRGRPSEVPPKGFSAGKYRVNDIFWRSNFEIDVQCF